MQHAPCTMGVRLPKPPYQRLVTSALRSDPSTLLMTRLVYWLEPSRRARRTTPWSTHPPHPVELPLTTLVDAFGLRLVGPRVQVFFG